MTKYNVDGEQVQSSAKEKDLARISKAYRISAVYVFGSRSEEATALIRQNSDKLVKSDRDVDIAVLPEIQFVLSAREKVEITLELEDLFGAPRVDLVVLPEAEPFLALDIIRGELLYAEDLDRQADYELYILRRAGDLLPFKKERIRMIMEEGAR